VAVSLDRRLDLIARFDAFVAPPGVVVLPARTPPSLWLIATLISEVTALESHVLLVECASCAYPKLPASCAACELVRVPAPKEVIRWPKPGVVRVPFRWVESVFLRTTQRAWCSDRGVREAPCPQCGHPIANQQQGCLICWDLHLYGIPGRSNGVTMREFIALSIYLYK